VLSDHLDTKFVLGGEELRVITGDPISPDTLAAAERKLGWPLPDDYRTCLTTCGAANVLGAVLLHPPEWRARAEPLTDNPVGRMANFLPFARKAIPTGGDLLFCFRFELELLKSAADVAAFSRGEARPTFHGAEYQVVACHLPTGLSGARLESSHPAMAPTFSAWVDQVVALVRARSTAQPR
jgi:hypothetical protein